MKAFFRTFTVESNIQFKIYYCYNYYMLIKKTKCDWISQIDHIGFIPKLNNLMTSTIFI